MPIPFLVAGAIAASALGAKGHLSAKKTNEEAQQIANSAQSMYNDAKNKLENAKKTADSALMSLGNKKVSTLNGSIKKFLDANKHIKEIQMTYSEGLDELSDVVMDEQNTLQLQKMVDIYSSNVSAGVGGAAAGAVVALAASGSLPLIATGLSTAGSLLVAGDIGLAASFAGSALSIGVTMTPLAAVVAPVVLFTGVSASMKAEENLEKAKTMRSQANAAVEKMAVEETLCKGITERSQMFEALLKELDGLFTPCVDKLDQTTKKIQKRLSVAKVKGFFTRKKVDEASVITREEFQLMAVARSLAKAVKTVIDVPILQDGSLSSEAMDVYNSTKENIPMLTASAQSVR